MILNDEPDETINNILKLMCYLIITYFNSSKKYVFIAIAYNYVLLLLRILFYQLLDLNIVGK